MKRNLSDFAKHTSRQLTGLTIAILAILTVQGWTGDFVNLFAYFQADQSGDPLMGSLTLFRTPAVWKSFTLFLARYRSA